MQGVRIVCHHVVLMTCHVCLVCNQQCDLYYMYGVHWRASPEDMPLWGPRRFWPGSGLVGHNLRSGLTL